MSTLRLLVPGPLVEGESRHLDEGAARHVQVWRMQPGDALRLFDGQGSEHEAQVLAIGRQQVSVLVGAARQAVPELALHVTLAVGLMANERMDTLVEKATELGVHAIQPLECERSVLRLSGERARRKRDHWQAVAVAASEQCGRAQVPQVAEVHSLAKWLQTLTPVEADPGLGIARLLLSFSADAESPAAARQTLERRDGGVQAVLVLSGPEGGLSPAEETAARAAGFRPVTLGPRVLRADTAPLALLAWWALRE